MQQIMQAYGAAIGRLAGEYGLPVAVAVCALLAVHTTLRALARFRLGRGPHDR